MLHTCHPPALYPLTPITTLFKTFSIWVVFTLSFPQFLRILVSAPGTEQTTVKCRDGLAEQSWESILQPEGESSSPHVSKYLLTCPWARCWIPTSSGGAWPRCQEVSGKREFPLQGSIKYRIMFSSDVVSISHRLLKDAELHVCKNDKYWEHVPYLQTVQGQKVFPTKSYSNNNLSTLHNSK